MLITSLDNDRIKGYIASNIELDKAVELLIKRLEEANKLDDTVIIITPDHYPYGLTLDEVNELSNYTKDENFEMHHMSFLVWNSEMKEPGEWSLGFCFLCRSVFRFVFRKPAVRRSGRRLSRNR